MRLSAYLVSGAFRVHRAGFRDCQKEARRSDSAGTAEEYASRTEVIAGLWSDIIAEKPGGVRRPRRPGQPGSRDHLPALYQRAARYQPGRGRRPAWRGGRTDRLGRRTRPGGRGPGRPRPRRLQQASVRGEQRRPGLPGQVPGRDRAPGVPGPCSATCGQRRHAGPPPALQPRLRPARSSARRRLPASSACRRPAFTPTGCRFSRQLLSREPVLTSTSFGVLSELSGGLSHRSFLFFRYSLTVGPRSASSAPEQPLHAHP